MGKGQGVPGFGLPRPGEGKRGEEGYLGYLMRQAAGNITRLSLELGGHAPFIVFDDADLDAAVGGLMASKFRNGGQTCICANRILVQEGVAEAFVAKLGEAVGGLRLGAADDPEAPVVDLGQR